MKAAVGRRASLILAAAAFLACGDTNPRPLVVGQDSCEFCRMAITDTRFGGEIVLTTGRHRTFDAVDCLAGYLAAGSDSAQVAAIYVSDYESRRLIDAASAVYLRGGSPRGPMGELTAFPPGSDPAVLASKYGGTTLDWAQVRQMARSGEGHAHPPDDPGTAARPPS